jgi:protein O-GlcNAc transferase
MTPEPPPTVPYGRLLGRALRLLRAGEPGAADAICRHVLTVDPDNPTAVYLAGVVARDLGDLGRSYELMDRAVRLQPTDAESHCGRGIARWEMNQPDAAVADFERALALDPNHAQANLYLGLSFLSRDLLAEAAERFERAATAEPPQPMALVNLGLVKHRQGRLDEAVGLYRRVLELDPSLRAARNNLAGALQELGQVEDALAILRQLDAEALDPQVGANLLTCLNLLPGDPTTFFDEAKRWAGRFADPLAQPGPRPAADPERRLRIGYIGADGLRRHTLAMTYVPLFEAHDPAQFEIVAYSDLAEEHEDEISRRLQAVSTWHRTGRLDDAGLAERIRADGIDILVDGIGFASGSRLLAFARRPAPIQAHFPPMSTSGMTAMDYLVGDAYLLPPGVDRCFSERLWRLPCGFLYQPANRLPAVSEPPATRNGFVTFGSFNRLAKIGDETIAAWAGVLNAAPGSRLIIGANAGLSPENAARYAGRFAANGVPAGRLDIRDSSHRGQRALAQFADIDIALDTFPFGGVLTTCAALAMGVPVVTRAGERILERYGAAILTAVGFTEGIARDRDDYVARAAALAGDVPRLAALRSTLRPQLLGSPLCDGPSFACSLETAYRSMWRDWCRTQGERPASGADRTT